MHPQHTTRRAHACFLRMSNFLPSFCCAFPTTGLMVLAATWAHPPERNLACMEWQSVPATASALPC